MDGGEDNHKSRLRVLKIHRLVEEDRNFSLAGSKLDVSEALAFIGNAPVTSFGVVGTYVRRLKFFRRIRRWLFTERVSEIMQQHLDITATMEEMKHSLGAKNLEVFRNAFDKFVAVMNVHFPVEESEVFSMASF